MVGKEWISFSVHPERSMERYTPTMLGRKRRNVLSCDFMSRIHVWALVPIVEIPIELEAVMREIYWVSYLQEKPVVACWSQLPRCGLWPPLKLSRSNCARVATTSHRVGSVTIYSRRNSMWYDAGFRPTHFPTPGFRGGSAYKSKPRLCNQNLVMRWDKIVWTSCNHPSKAVESTLYC